MQKTILLAACACLIGYGAMAADAPKSESLQQALTNEMFMLQATKINLTAELADTKAALKEAQAEVDVLKKQIDAGPLPPGPGAGGHSAPPVMTPGK